VKSASKSLASGLVLPVLDVTFPELVLDVTFPELVLDVTFPELVLPLPPSPRVDPVVPAVLSGWSACASRIGRPLPCDPVGSTAPQLIDRTPATHKTRPIFLDIAVRSPPIERPALFGTPSGLNEFQDCRQSNTADPCELIVRYRLM
jgi:hypothetical protein